MTMRVHMAWADITDKSREYVNDVLDTGWLSRHKYIPRFESEIARLHVCKYGVMMNSGTDALRIALATLKEIHKWPEGSEVIVPAVTFVATVNVVMQVGLRPVFVDVDRWTYNLDPGKIASQVGPDTVAVIPVHLFGLPANMSAVMSVARKHKLKVIEDSCECLGVSKVRGDMAAYSFYMSHHITCGVGGVLLTNNATYDKIARSFMNHGRNDASWHFQFDRVGYSSRCTEFEAAMGCAGLKRFKGNLAIRQKLGKMFADKLRWMSHLIQSPVLAGSSVMMFPIVLKQGNRDKLIKYLKAHGVESREAMPLVNQKPYLHLYQKGSCPVAERINETGMCLPIHPLMTEKDVNYVVTLIERFLDA